MNYIRIAGVALATFLCYHYLGMPWGLLAGCSIAMLFLSGTGGT